MELKIDAGVGIYVNRDGIAHEHPKHMRNGFEVSLDGFLIHFRDELDAENLAKAILYRLGVNVEGWRAISEGS